MPERFLIICILTLLHLIAMLCSGSVAQQNIAVNTLHLERVTTIAPFPRGLAMVDGALYVLCRGRVRGAGKEKAYSSWPWK